MANFTLREPPSMSGDRDRDMAELFSWCREVYEALWLDEFYAMQKRKKGGESDEGENN